MNKNYFLSGVLILVHIFVSCTDDREQLSSGNAVSFIPSITGNEVATRASEDSWEDNDRVGIYMVPHVADPSTAADFSVYTHHTNVQYKTSNSGASVPLTAVGDVIIYPAGDVDVNFVAYYPYRSTLHSTENDIYPINVATQSPTKDIDFLYHKGTGTAYRGKTASNVGLEFEHQLSKWIVCIEPASAGVAVDLSTATASISGFPSAASFNLSTGTMSNQGGTDAVLTPIKDTDNSSTDKATFVALLVPHAGGSSYTRTLSVVIEGHTYEYTVPASHSFEPGMSHAYNLKFTGSKLLLLQKTIVDWQGGSIAWNDDFLVVNKTNINLEGNDIVTAIKISTTSTDPLKVYLSKEKSTVSPTEPDWITANLSPGSTADGWTSYELTLNVKANSDQDNERTGYIHMEVNGLTIVANINQEPAVIHVSDPYPNLIEFAAIGDGAKTFTFTTNSLIDNLELLITNTPYYGPSEGAIYFTGKNASRDYDSGTGISTWTVTLSADEIKNVTSPGRSSYVSFRVGTIEKRVTVRQQKLIFPITDNLANCYMVVPGGNVSFPIERAITVGDMDPDASFTIETIWDDNNVYDSYSVSGSGKDRVISVTANNVMGNALIALKSEGEIYWSWHIWATDYDGVATWSNNGFEAMDRNLGAVKNDNSVDAIGLFYQWGRKDPFPNPNSAIPLVIKERPEKPVGSEIKITLEGILHTVRNPDYFITVSNNWLWSLEYLSYFWNSADKKKTVYDPCPQGWRVPYYNGADLLWSGITAVEPFDKTSEQNGTNLGLNGLHPAAGSYRYSNGSYHTNGYGQYWIAYRLVGTAQYFYFGNTGDTRIASTNMTTGNSIRCVKE